MSWPRGRLFDLADAPRRWTIVLVGTVLVYVVPWLLPTPPRFGG